MHEPTTQHQTNEDAEREASEAEANEAREAKRQEQIRRNQAAIEMLQEWMQEDPEEQRETWEIIERGLRESPFTLRTCEP